MEQRTCDVAGLGAGLICWYVDPARAQGSTGWRSGTYNPSNPNSYTPLPKPFYVLEANGREYRYWLPADTGFDIGITGHKPVTDNARTSLTWQRSAPLCDRTQGRGECGPVARVATTPWGPRTAEPFGALDSVTSNPDGSARVTGWALDPDTNDPDRRALLRRRGRSRRAAPPARIGRMSLQPSPATELPTGTTL